MHDARTVSVIFAFLWCFCVYLSGSDPQRGQGSRSKMLGDLVINRCLATTHHLSRPLTQHSPLPLPLILSLSLPCHISIALTVLHRCSSPLSFPSVLSLPVTSPTPHFPAVHTFLTHFPTAGKQMNLLMGWEGKSEQWELERRCWAEEHTVIDMKLKWHLCKDTFINCECLKLHLQ